MAYFVAHPRLGDFTNERLSTSERFDVRDNNLSGTIPPVFGMLTGLNKIILRQNKLVGSIPLEFGLLERLRSLALDDNQLTGTVPTELLQLSNLSESIHLVFRLSSTSLQVSNHFFRTMQSNLNLTAIICRE